MTPIVACVMGILVVLVAIDVVVASFYTAFAVL
jgi:hypothetical protein